MLKGLGHTCEEAEDGQQAVDKVQRVLAASAAPFDAVLMDYMMPVLDGPSATKAIRALGYTGKIIGYARSSGVRKLLLTPTVTLCFRRCTGNGLKSDIDTFTASGADAVLLKPLDMALFNVYMTDVTPA